MMHELASVAGWLAGWLANGQANEVETMYMYVCMLLAVSVNVII